MSTETVYILQASHRTTPGIMTRAFSTHDAAVAARAELRARFKGELEWVEILTLAVEPSATRAIPPRQRDHKGRAI
jgi:hypothetical protein